MSGHWVLVSWKEPDFSAQGTNVVFKQVIKNNATAWCIILIYHYRWAEIKAIWSKINIQIVTAPHISYFKSKVILNKN